MKKTNNVEKENTIKNDYKIDKKKKFSGPKAGVFNDELVNTSNISNDTYLSLEESNLTQFIDETSNSDQTEGKTGSIEISITDNQGARRSTRIKNIIIICVTIIIFVAIIVLLVVKN